MQFDFGAELWGLFISAFISSTLAPGGSEIILAYLVLNSDVPHYKLGLIATIGNTLGALTTLALGCLTALKFSPGRLKQSLNPRAVSLVRKWGVVALLFSWLPLIGDALCFAAGWLRLSVIGSAFFITMGKALRYSVLIYYLV